MLRYALILITFVLSFLQSSYSGSNIEIKDCMFHIDFYRKLIIVNQNIQPIQNKLDSNAHILQFSNVCTIEFKYDSAQYGKKYQVELWGDYFSLYFTELPIIEINIDGEVNDTLKVPAKVTISESNGKILTSNIGIKYRGGSSIWAPKKSYRVEFWSDSLGDSTRDVSLFGMRNDDDWNFNSMQNEPLRIRSVSGNQLWNSIHKPYYLADEPKAKSGIENRFAELIMNGNYLGVFAVGERIDPKQLKLINYDGKMRGELYKGITWVGGATVYKQCPPFKNGEEFWAGFEYNYPDEIEPDWSNLYDFVDFVVNSDDEEFYNGYKHRFKFENLIDYFLFLNLSFAVDNTGKNVWVAKYDKNDPYFYVPWDLDGTMGLQWDGTYYENSEWILSNGFYDRLLCDCSTEGFFYRAKTRWQELRKKALDYNKILEIYKQNYSYLSKNAVYDRELMAWGNFKYPNYDYDRIPDWLRARLKFIDDYFAKGCENSKWDNSKIKSYCNLFPNPANDYVNVELGDDMLPATVEVFNSLGEKVLKFEAKENINRFNVTNYARGVYNMRISKGNKSLIKQFIIIKWFF